MATKRFRENLLHWSFQIGIILKGFDGLLAFIGCQIFRLCGHFSIGLALFTALDAIIVALVWHEYRSRVNGTHPKS
jgi:uncharacterized membrane protein